MALKEENNYQKQECLVITKDMVSKQSRKIPNWKAPGRDGVKFRASGSKNWQTCMNEPLFYWIRFWMEKNNWLIGWLMGERFCVKKIILKGT